ncbi:MAG: hypothetical protein E7164_04825 [Firmicutes bacterium]|nr:hypothetical protein [Bacillota bacterium]
MKKFIAFLVGILLITGCSKRTISTESFEKGMKNILSVELLRSKYEVVKLEKKQMLVRYDDEEYTLNYNLKGAPVFTYQQKIRKGTSAEEYAVIENGLSLVMIGYIAIANMYDLSVEDSYAYFIENYLNALDAVNKNKDTYILTDSINGYDENEKVILFSEFQDRVVEYIKSKYDKVLIIKDDKYNTFDYKLVTKCNRNSCNFKVSLTINPDGDFNKIKGYDISLKKQSMEDSITPGNADYHVQLEVGQSITIFGNNLIRYDIAGMNVVDIKTKDSKYIFKAINEGVANGYFFLNNEEYRTYYITVTNSNNEDISDISLKIK